MSFLTLWRGFFLSLKGKNQVLGFLDYGPLARSLTNSSSGFFSLLYKVAIVR
jgi:hypothetical protein